MPPDTNVMIATLKIKIPGVFYTRYCLAAFIHAREIFNDYLTESTRPLKVSGSFIARSANTFRSSVIPF